MCVVISTDMHNRTFNASEGQVAYSMATNIEYIDSISLAYQAQEEKYKK